MIVRTTFLIVLSWLELAIIAMMSGLLCYSKTLDNSSPVITGSIKITMIHIACYQGLHPCI